MKNGTLSRVPLENVIGHVLAAANQDTFALGVDTCFILANPAIRTRNDDMWVHWVRGMSVAGGGGRLGCEGGGSSVLPRNGGAVQCKAWFFAVSENPLPL